MNKGISFYFGFVYDNIEQQVKDIKEAGFDCVITNADPRFTWQNGSIRKQVKLFKKYGLKLSSLHMRYKTEDLPHFWTNDKVGDKLERDLKKDLKVAKKYGFTSVVAHFRGEINQIGYDRLKRLLKVCEKLNVPIAAENINLPNCCEQMFEDIKNPYFKFCYDSGHCHAFNGDQEYITMYSDRLVALHLHDNLGSNPQKRDLKGFIYENESLDMHTLNKYGNIDWENIAKQLAAIKQPINLDYEMLMIYRKGETAKDVLKEVYQQACELEKMIEKYKQ